MKKIFILIILFAVASPVLADSLNSPHYRIFYRPDGSVIQMTLNFASCIGLTESQCFDREAAKDPSLASLPHDDYTRDQLPDTDTNFDKWRGAKGQGVHVDATLTSKQEEVDKLQNNLDSELSSNNPDSIKVAKLQRAIDKVRNSDKPVFNQDEAAAIEDSGNKKTSALASVFNAVGDAVSGVIQSITDGFLKLASLVTDSLQIGSADKPAGITTYDQITKQPYCLIVANGQIQTTPGVCGSQTEATTTTPSAVSSTTTPIDTTPPVITLNGDNPTTINKGDSFVDLGAIVTDNVDHNLGVEVSGDTVDTSKPATYHIHYNAADNAGNKAIEVIRTVNVIDPYAATSTTSAEATTTDNTATSTP